VGIWDKKEAVPVEQVTGGSGENPVDPNSTIRGSINAVRSEVQRVRARLEDMEAELDAINAQVGE
jgi:hypothetical protein